MPLHLTDVAVAVGAVRRGPGAGRRGGTSEEAPPRCPTRRFAVWVLRDCDFNDAVQKLHRVS